jgi:hypothetical protein
MASNADHPFAGHAASVMPMSACPVSILIQRWRWPEPCTPARPIRHANGRTGHRARRTPVRRSVWTRCPAVQGVIMRGGVLGSRRRTFVRVRSSRGRLTCEPGTVRNFREPSDLAHLGADLDLRPNRSDGAIWTACWSMQAPQHRARYRSPSRCSGAVDPRSTHQKC